MNARALYICYLSLADPLVQDPGRGVSRRSGGRGHTIHLLTFETELSRSTRARAARRDGRARHRVARLRYHKRPSLPATVYDTFAGAVVGVVAVRAPPPRGHPHARSHVPLAMALLARLRHAPEDLIFDIRGLLAEEYADAGRWQRDGAAVPDHGLDPARGLRRADGFVVLTERVRRQLWGEHPPRERRCDPVLRRLRPAGSRETRRTRRARARRPARSWSTSASSRASTWTARWPTSSRSPAGCTGARVSRAHPVARRQHRRRAAARRGPAGRLPDHERAGSQDVGALSRRRRLRDLLLPPEALADRGVARRRSASTWPRACRSSRAPMSATPTRSCATSASAWS